MNTAEEIHLLCYFSRRGGGLAVRRAFCIEALPALPYDEPAIWGRQLVTDEEDHVLDKVEKLLTGAVRLTLAEAAALCRRMGGVPVPAHADADSYSVFSVLGGWPMDVDFELLEVKFPERAEKLMAAGLLPADRPVLTSSDAHCIEAVASRMSTLGEGSPLYRLLG